MQRHHQLSKIILLAFTLLLFTTQALALSNTSLLSWYKLDESSGTNVIDYKGFDSNGTTFGTVTREASGKINYAVSAVSTTTTPSNNRFNATISDLPTKGISVGFWYKNKGGGDNDFGFMSNRNGATAGINLYYDSNVLACQVNANAYGPAATYTSATDSAWHYFVCVYKTDGNIVLYLDGQQKASSTWDLRNLNGDKNMTFLGEKSSISPTGNYYMDEIGIWATSLTSTDVTDLYNTNTGVTYCGYGDYDSNFMSTCSKTPTTVQKITFNVFRNGTSTDLSAVDYDCNVNALDLTNQTSPFTSTTSTNTYASCDFKKTGYDTNTQLILYDSNKTLTIYLKDTTAPSVGSTTLTGFTTYNNYIGGTGKIYATATDTSGETLTCEYSDNNGSSWASADYNASGGVCQKDITVTTKPYVFNLRATDPSNNTGTGTATTQYLGDATNPTTTFSSFQPTGTYDQNITLTCADSNSGCKTINWKINSGTWNQFKLIQLDYNLFDSNTYSIYAPATTNYQLAKTFNIHESGKIKYLNSIKDEMSVSYTGGTGNAYYKIVFMDGTNENTTTNSTTSASWVSKTFTVTTQNKDVNYIELWMNFTVQGTNYTYARNHEMIIDINSYGYNPYNFLYNGAGVHSIQYYSTDNVDNNAYPGNTNSFTTYGVVSFNFYDENTGLTLTDVNVNVTPAINGISNWITTGVNTLDFNLQGITPANYLFEINKTSTLYGSRYYQMDLNEGSVIDINFALLPLTQQLDVPFKVYDTNGTNTFNNTYILLYRPDRNNLVAGRLKTDSLGNATFGLNAFDQNYFTNVNNGQYTYQAVALTILYPKNEQTLLQITEKWRIDITQNLFISYTDLNSNKIIYLLPNTTLPFNIKIRDINQNYFARTYTKQYLGNPGTDTLQPYLVSSTSGLLTTINTIDSTTLTPVQQITLKIYKYISGSGRTFVEQVTTDSKGQALTLLVLADEYEFEIYQNNALIRTDIITATSASIDIKIPSSATQNLDNNFYLVTIKNIPLRGKLIKTDLDLNQLVTLKRNGSNSTLINNVRVWITDQNSTYTFFDTTTAVNGLTFTNSVDTNFIDSNAKKRTINSKIYDGNLTIIVNVRVTTSDGNIITQSFVYGLPSNYSITEGLGNGLRGTFGCSATNDPLLPCGSMLLAALFLSLIGTIGLASATGFASMESMAVVFLAFLGIFAYLGWIPFLLYGLMLLISVVLGVAIGGNRL